jgi:multidrug efflux system membrane fusion protein
MTDSIVKPVRLSKKLCVLIFLVLALILAGSWWWQAGASASRDPRHRKNTVLMVTDASVQQRDMPIYLTALGTVTPNNTVTVHSMVNGTLQQLGFSEGQQVRAGQMLAQLDPRPYQVQLTQAQGQMAHDQALLANARVDLARYRTLLAQNSIAQQQVATQEALVRQYEGTVEVDRGAIASARLNLSYCRITAPLAGRVGLKQVDLGNVVHSTDANGVVVITQMQPASIVFSLPEGQLTQVRQAIHAGQTLPVEAWDRQNQHKLAEGHLLTTDNQMDTSTGTVKLKAVFSNRDDVLFPNQFVNVRLRTELRSRALVIPLSAMQRGQPGTFVYRINPDQTVSLRVIRPGPADGEQLIVESGLAAGDRIVLDGVDRLREGARVTVSHGSAPGNGGAGGKGTHHRQKQP